MKMWHHFIFTYGKAIHSISIFTPLGSSLTATQLLAGRCLIHFSYSAFISPKSFMSVKKISTLTILSSEELADKRTAESAFMHALVFPPTLPSIKFPFSSAGSWPEQYIAWGVLIACDWGGNVRKWLRALNLQRCAHIWPYCYRTFSWVYQENKTVEQTRGSALA